MGVIYELGTYPHSYKNKFLYNLLNNLPNCYFLNIKIEDFVKTKDVSWFVENFFWFIITIYIL